MHELTAEQREVSLRFAHVLLPDYVFDCEAWEWHADTWHRLFTVEEWRVGAVLVAVSGEQTHLGDVTLWIYVGGEEQLSNPEGRQLTAALLNAEELLEQLS
jgi:hypothetical protein